MSDKYDVGYRKPPTSTRFKKGRSGNPKGRPKGTRNFESDVKETLQMPVPLKKDGKTRSVSTQEAALLRLREQALKGDARALDRILALAQAHNSEDLSETVSETLAPSDQQVLDEFVIRVRKKNKELSPVSTETDEGEEDDDDAWLR